ncbi:MAG: type IX secretion system membrane protein PorP/SprF [Bacteroidota bacterium]
MKLRYIIPTFATAFLLLLTGPLLGQQEFQFTQFMHNQLFINPAYAGARDMTSLLAIYRNQYAGFEGSPQSRLVSINTPILGQKVGFGFSVSNHTAGITNLWYGSMAYSYKLQITKDAAVRFGLQGSIRYYGFDFEDPAIFIRDGGDPSLSENMETKYAGNFGAGLYFTYKQVYFGLSVPHFFPNEITLNRTNVVDLVAQEVPHFYAIAGVMLPVSEKLHLKPAILAKYVQNAPFDLDANISMVFDYRITAGVSYRHGGDDLVESIDLLLMYQHKSIGIGLAYDVGISGLGAESGGSWEVLLRYDFLKEQDNIANPRFFF